MDQLQVVCQVTWVIYTLYFVRAVQESCKYVLSFIWSIFHSTYTYSSQAG